MTKRRFELHYNIIMSSLLLSLLGLSIGAQLCSVWKEIAPCTCTKEISRITITCEKMSSYSDIVNVLQNRFAPTDKVILQILLSTLDDLPQRSFKELNMTIENIQLRHDNLSELSSHSFVGLTNLNYLSLSDNNIGTIPEHILEKVPNVKTLDLGRIGIRQLTGESFKHTPYVQNIMLGGNLISQMEVTSIPANVRHLHLGRNKIKDLNGTLTNLTDLEWVFINANELTTLENQLPISAPRLVMIFASDNEIEKLPQHLNTYASLQSLFIHNNKLTSLDGALSKLRKLERASLEHNRISVLTKEDFTETESLQCVCMGNNLITSLNNSLSPLRSLTHLNLTHNLLTEFSLQEIKRLHKLRTVDLSYNQISRLSGPAANLVEWETKLVELILNNNELHELNGALSGLPSLIKLNLSYNKLTQISPDDLIGLDRLQFLDISHNQLTTLEETGKSVLPALNELIASHNRLTVMDHDFHGLPVLCWADLSNNQIVALGRDLVSKTRCKMQDTWGTLKVLLQDNPILCDAALPEIVAAMEVNHTRISGVSHCGPLSEQPTTSKPNGFLGFIPENIDTHEQADLKTNPFYNQPIYKPIPLVAAENSDDINKKREPTPTYQAENNEPRIDGGNIAPDESLINQDNEPSNVKSELQSNRNDLPGQELKPYPLDIFETQQSNLNDQLHKSEDKLEQRLNGEHTFKNIDTIKQQQQLNQLVTQIEELRLKVEELTAQNKILSHNINTSSGETDQSSMFEDKNVVPEIIPQRSTEKTSYDQMDELSITS